MMPLPIAVQATARATRLIMPTLHRFLETRHCRRMSVRKNGIGSSGSLPCDVDVHVRTWSPTTRNVNAARPGDGRRRRGSKVEKAGRFEDDSKQLSSSGAINSQFQPRKRRGNVSARGRRPKPFLQSSNSLLADQVKGDDALSSRIIGSHPQTPSPNPISMDEQTPQTERHSYDKEVEEVEAFRRTTNPPSPKTSLISHPPRGGISGNAAAIAYLRIRGLANRGKGKIFYTLLAWLLRHAARELGFEIVPDGFVRVSDLLQFEPFQTHTLETFSKACVKDIFDRFEVISLPDLVNDKLREIWWVRARDSHTIPGVNPSNKRIINMGRLQTVVYRAPFADWSNIQEYGILEEPDRFIRLYQSGTSYFRNIIPRHSRHVCITIDAQKAAELGVKFFHTPDVDLLAVGKNGSIPFRAIRSVVELEITKQVLM